MLTQAYLQEILHYSIITGQFYRLVSTSNRVKIGDLAGTLNDHGYRQIEINGKFYKSHRLAWFYCTNEWPENDIDHKNGIRDANYWLNLRKATRSENNYNTGVPKTNTSGFKGVSLYKPTQKWRARIKVEGKHNHLGYYETPELAYEARIIAEKNLHGEFARL